MTTVRFLLVNFAVLIWTFQNLITHWLRKKINIAINPWFSIWLCKAVCFTNPFSCQLLQEQLFLKQSGYLFTQFCSAFWLIPEGYHLFFLQQYLHYTVGNTSKKHSIGTLSHFHLLKSCFSHPSPSFIFVSGLLLLRLPPWAPAVPPLSSPC